MTDGNGVSVLIAEDDYLVAQTIQGLLTDLGYAIAGEAGNGVQALEMTRDLKPDVVLMDIKMPTQGGIETAREIQAHEPTPVVILTAYETSELVHRASEAGVGAYLIKPPQARDLDKGITIARARFEDMMALRRVNQRLELRNEELDAYAYTVAHDLQNPLSLIFGYSEALLKYRASMSSEEIERSLKTLMKTARSMSQITDQLLLLARARRADDTQLKPLDMGRVLARTQERLSRMIEEFEAEIALAEHWPPALGYAPWVEQVWVNYISNAIQHGGRPPRVQIGASPASDGYVCFWVQDNGPGIEPEEQARLFTPFTRLGQTRTKGYGLGLSIVRRIVEKLGGEVGVESQVGQGSTFTFTLHSVD